MSLAAVIACTLQEDSSPRMTGICCAVKSAYAPQAPSDHTPSAAERTPHEQHAAATSAEAAPAAAASPKTPQFCLCAAAALPAQTQLL